MSPDVHILLSGALSFGVPLLLAVRELVVLGRESGGPARGGDSRETMPAAPPPSDEPSLPPLPPCLVQALRGEPGGHGESAPRRVRVLEEA